MGGTAEALRFKLTAVASCLRHPMNNIECSTAHGVMTISFNRPDRKNSITGLMYGLLTDAMNSAREDGEVRSVLIEGSHDIFSAGNDVGEFLNDPPLDPSAPAFGFLRTIAEFPKPLVAAVCGAAVGVGSTMLFHCDLVYASEDAMFSLPFIDLGLCPEAGSALLAPQMLGYHKAAEALLLGDPISATSALTLGLVNRVLPSAEVSPFARAQAARLAAKPLSGLLETKRLMKVHQQSFLKAQMEEEGKKCARSLTCSRVLRRGKRSLRLRKSASPTSAGTSSSDVPNSSALPSARLGEQYASCHGSHSSFRRASLHLVCCRSPWPVHGC